MLSEVEIDDHVSLHLLRVLDIVESVLNLVQAFLLGQAFLLENRLGFMS